MLVMLINVLRCPGNVKLRTEAADNTDIRSNTTRNPGCLKYSDSPGFI